MDLQLRQRRVPGRAGILMEQQRLIGGYAQPGIALDFLFQLSGGPAGIAKRQQAFAWATTAGNRAQDIHTRGQGQTSAKTQATLRRPVIRVQHKAAPGFHWAARDQPDLALRRHGLQPKLLQQFVKRQPFNRAIDDQPHRPLSGMVAQTDNALREAFILHPRHCDQQMPGQVIASTAGAGFALSRHAANVAP